MFSQNEFDSIDDILYNKGSFKIRPRTKDLITMATTGTEDIFLFGKEVGYNGITRDSGLYQTKDLSVLVDYNGVEYTIPLSLIDLPELEIYRERFIKYTEQKFEIENELMKLFDYGSMVAINKSKMEESSWPYDKYYGDEEELKLVSIEYNESSPILDKSSFSMRLECKNGVSVMCNFDAIEDSRIDKIFNKILNIKESDGEMSMVGMAFAGLAATILGAAIASKSPEIKTTTSQKKEKAEAAHVRK